MEGIVDGLPLNQELRSDPFYDISNQTPSAIVKTRPTQNISVFWSKDLVWFVSFCDSMYRDT